jgi:hypothetical protein
MVLAFAVMIKAAVGLVVVIPHDTVSALLVESFAL